MRALHEAQLADSGTRPEEGEKRVALGPELVELRGVKRAERVQQESRGRARPLDAFLGVHHAGRPQRGEVAVLPMVGSVTDLEGTRFE